MGSVSVGVTGAAERQRAAGAEAERPGLAEWRPFGLGVRSVTMGRTEPRSTRKATRDDTPACPGA